MHQLLEATYWIGGIGILVWLLRDPKAAQVRESNIQFAAGKMGNLNRVDTPLLDTIEKMGPLEAQYAIRQMEGRAPLDAQQRLDIIDNPNKTRYNAFNVVCDLPKEGERIEFVRQPLEHESIGPVVNSHVVDWPRFDIEQARKMLENGHDF